MAEKEEGSERRRAPRYPILMTGEARFADIAERGAFRVVASNISDGGMGGMVLHALQADMLNIGDILLLEFPDPVHYRPVRLRARVMWKRRNSGGLLGNWSFGVRFHSTPEMEIRWIYDPAEAAATMKYADEPKPADDGGREEEEAEG